MDSDTFINLISTNNQEIFDKLNLKRLCKELRQNIYNFLISRKSEEDFFDITSYTKNPVKKECVEIIYKELETAGWKHSLSYGDTGLFIYRETIPKNCW